MPTPSATTSSSAITSPRSVPVTRSERLLRKAAIAIGASLFVAVCAHLSVPLPFTPVPLTLSNLAVLLVGLALEPAVAFSALALYLAEGAAGTPVFSPLGPGGVAQLLGPTGGFLFAYPLAAAATSFLSRRLRSVALPSKINVAVGQAIACSVATFVIMTLGALWLGVELHLTPSATFLMGVAPFLPGEAVKIVAASGIASTGLFAGSRPGRQ